MKTRVILITADFPYGRDEISFIQPELPYIQKNAEVSILSRNESDRQVVEVPSQIKVCRVINKRSQNIRCALTILFSPMFYREMYFIWKKKHNYFGENLKEAFLTLSIAKRTAESIEENFGTKKCNSNIVLYSYWFDGGTLAALLYKKKHKKDHIRVVSRIHGCDLYEERTRTEYQPYMQQMDQMIDNVYFISRIGMEYYKAHYGCEKNKDKYKLCYLGTQGGRPVLAKKDNIFRLISCAHLIPLKRVTKIIDALEAIDDYIIEWTHFGGGECEKEIRQYANNKLGIKENISYYFSGVVNNEQIHQAYEQNDYDCFISASETEGIPVSMMEALSYGVPVISTNVGGVSEILNEKCGRLLNANPSSEELSNAICEIYNMTNEEKKHMCMEAKRQWEEKFDAEKNYEDFAKVIIKYE